MILANQILNSIENISFANDQSFKSKITKFDGKLLSVIHFPHLLEQFVNYFVMTEVMLLAKLLDLEKRKI